MDANIAKRYPTIACCGIDCGLCPRHHADGRSRCPGCFGDNFQEQHPSCSILTCCIKKRQFETCADCADFPCVKLNAWDSADSFVTHKNSLKNLRCIRANGLPSFIERQSARIELLKTILKHYDDGRSKSFFCLALTLMPIAAVNAAVEEVKRPENKPNDKKSLAKSLRNVLQEKAGAHGILLAYRKKKT